LEKVVPNPLKVVAKLAFGKGGVKSTKSVVNPVFIIYQHYPPGTQENYNNFSSRNLIMGKGNDLEFPEGRGGGKGEPPSSPYNICKLLKETQLYIVKRCRNEWSDNFCPNIKKN
jgi:hypothetical protein